MPPQLAHSLLVCAAVWCALGALFAPWFAWRGAARIDPVAAHGSIGFRLLLLPGALLLWPWLVRMLVRGRSRQEFSPHRSAARSGDRP